MAVHTSQFGSVRLTGKDAEEFRKRAMERSKPSEQAVHSLKRGRQLANEYIENGFVRVKVAK